MPGAGLLGEMAEETGLVDAWDRVLLGTYKAIPIHMPGQVLADLAVAIADGATSISDLAALRDQPSVFGAVASTPTAWRVLDRVSGDLLAGIRQGRAAARAAAWAAGAAPDLGGELHLDIDATIVIAHSEKEQAAPTWKRRFGFHPLVCFLDRPDIASGEALAGIVREGTPARTPRLITSRSLTWPWATCPRRPGLAPGILMGLVWSCGPMLLVPPMVSPPRAGPGVSGSATGSPSPTRSAKRSLRFPSTSGRQRSSPTATSVTVPRWPSSPA